MRSLCLLTVKPQASKGPFKAMYMRDYRLLVESLLSEESVKALGDLNWENSTVGPRLAIWLLLCLSSLFLSPPILSNS